MSFRFICPFCGQHLDCDDDLENTACNCPKCNNEIVCAKTKQTLNVILNDDYEIDIRMEETEIEAVYKLDDFNQYIQNNLTTINEIIYETFKAISESSKVMNIKFVGIGTIGSSLRFVFFNNKMKPIMAI